MRIVENIKLASSGDQMVAGKNGGLRVSSPHLVQTDLPAKYKKLAPMRLPGIDAEHNQPDSGSGARIQIPLINPNPPQLSLLTGALADIERSGIFSNYGPVNSKFEAQILELMFNSTGTCITVANATLGLMLAIKQAVGWRPRGRYALMPSFTFAAAAQAALWCGLTPLFCDIDRETWLPDAEAEDVLLQQYGDEIAVLLPNATFGNCLDLQRYDRLSNTHGIPLVIDAAAALGSLSSNGESFGLGSRHPLVFSTHATKSFSTGEGGLIYCADPEKIAMLRSMAGFGLNADRIVTLPGLNAKLSEVAALLALTKLQDIEAISDYRFKLHQLYRSLLPDFTFQHMTGQRSALQFVSVLLPADCSKQVPEIVAELARHGIGSGHYFAPHLAIHPFFRENSIAGVLGVTEEISRRIISLPISDFLTVDDVSRICEMLQQICRPHQRQRVSINIAVTNIQAAGSVA